MIPRFMSRRLGAELQTRAPGKVSATAASLHRRLCARPLARELSTTRQLSQGAWPEKFPAIKVPQAPILTQPTVSASAQGAVNKITVDMGVDYPPMELETGWLRDQCRCQLCINSNSGQKTFASSSVDRKPKIELVERSPDSGLKVVWADSGLSQDAGFPGEPHLSTYPFEWLASLNQPPQITRYRQWADEWGDVRNFKPLSINYDDWMNEGKAFQDAVLSLDKTGLIFLRGVPKDEQSVAKVTERIGHIYPAFYGTTWDVRSKPNAENVAFTNEFLGMHQDILYKADPPRIQILHCLENDATGGESMWSDGRAAARKLNERQYRDLEQWPVQYGYDKNGHYYQYSRPVFSGDLDPEFPEMGRQEKSSLAGQGDVNKDRRWKLAWSPPFQVQQHYPPTAGFQGHGMFAKWKAAARALQENLEDPNAVYEVRMKSGDCALFDNWRLVHGRRQFDETSGNRWLKGTYIDNQEFDSKVRLILREREKQGTWQVEGPPSLGVPTPVQPDAQRKPADRQMEDGAVEEEGWGQGLGEGFVPRLG